MWEIHSPHSSHFIPYSQRHSPPIPPFITAFRTFIAYSTLPYWPRFLFLPLKPCMQFSFDEFLTVTFTLFAVIDIIGSIPLLITLKEKMGGIRELRATLISGAFMILFLLVGERFLSIMGVDVKSFAVGGSIVIFILGLEMVLGVEFFKSELNPSSGSVVPIAFPLIAGSGTLTTVISLRAVYDQWLVLVAILANLIFVYLVLHSLDRIARLLGTGGLLAVRKFFGVILLAIAVKIFTTNVRGLWE